MNATRNQVKSLFLNALENIPPDRWESYLDEACEGNPELRFRVWALLDAHQKADSFVEQAAPTLAMDPAAAPLTEDLNTLIGPYKLIEQIGEGGMGVVYRAEQESPVRRQVALKLIKPGMDTRQVLARFDAERQALAMMDHPNIARILDAGADDAGRPFFVMELVRGLPITRYCDEARMPIRKRLELFAVVCQAVQHAHQKGIIHRDIKPTNVLVTLHDGAPVPKVIDFGVAKALGPPLVEGTTRTSFLQMIGTPLYMSPEQAGLSEDIDTRADIYSLGVLLYELLTGVTPFDREQLRLAAYEEVRRIIREVEPLTPSSRLMVRSTAHHSASAPPVGESRVGGQVVTEPLDRLPSVAALRHTEPSRLTKTVRGELDWIVMKCLEKDRRRRYETANGLAADVRRYLADEPIAAGPPSAWYRFKKGARRHRAALTTAAVVALALVAGTAVATWQALEARRARAEAITQRTRATSEAVTARAELAKFEMMFKFLTEDLLTQAEPEKNAVENQVTLLEVLDEAAKKVGERYASQPELEIHLRYVLARTYHALGAFGKANHQLELLRERARNVLDSDDPRMWEVLSEHGHIRFHLGHYTEAIELLRRGIAGLERTKDLTNPQLNGARNNLAGAYEAVGRMAEATKLLEENVARQTSAVGSEHYNTLASLNNLAKSYSAAGRTSEAITLYEQLVPLSKSSLGDDNPITLTSRMNLAVAYGKNGRKVEGLAILQTVIPLMSARLGPDHPNTLGSLHNLAAAYLNLDRAKEALEIYEQLVPIAKAKLGPNHPDTLKMLDLLAKVYIDVGRASEAIPIYEELLKRREAGSSSDGPKAFALRNNLGTAYLESGRSAEAIELLEKVVQERTTALGDEHSDTLASRTNLALAYQSAGGTSKAITILEEVVRIETIKLGSDAPDTLVSRSMLGECYAHAGRGAEAIRLLEETAQSMVGKLGPDHTRTLKCRSELAHAYFLTGRTADTIAVFEETVPLMRVKLGADHPTTLTASNNLAAAYWRSQRLDRSVPLFEEVLRSRVTKLGPDHIDTLRTQANLGINYRDAGRPAEGTRLLEEALGRLQKPDGSVPAELAWVPHQLALTYEQTAQHDRAEPIFRQRLEEARVSFGASDLRTAGAVAELGLNLLNQSKYSEAEPVLRECLAIRERVLADDWTRFNTMSMLGGALLGQERFGEAEPLIVEGFEGVHRRQRMIPPPGRVRVPEAAARVVQLYEAWGKPVEATRWRLRLGTILANDKMPNGTGVFAPL